jgi:GxxExxY protein
VKKKRRCWMEAYLYKELSNEVLGALYSVHAQLGPGLLESAYSGALLIEFRNRKLNIEREREFKLYYEGEVAGVYFADLVVEGKILLELKSVSTLTSLMEAQLLNYLRIGQIPVGYLVNFNALSLQYKRMVYSEFA